MSKTIFKNEVFSIVAKNEKDHELYYKGKLISKVDVNFVGNEFEITGRLESLLNFDAAMLPPGFELNYIHRPKGFYGWEGIFSLQVDKKKVLMEYFFWAEGKLLFNSDINLYKVVIAAMKMARKAGYRVSIDSLNYRADFRNAYVYVSISPKGNVYEHYKTHLDILRQYFQQAHASLIQNIIKNR